jgi:hypothetical protein
VVDMGKGDGGSLGGKFCRYVPLGFSGSLNLWRVNRRTGVTHSEEPENFKGRYIVKQTIRTFFASLPPNLSHPGCLTRASSACRSFSGSRTSSNTSDTAILLP